MKVVVTGASGYIGSHTCKVLKQQGYHVVGVDRNKPKHTYYDKFVEANYESIQHHLLDIDAVVHIAATSLVGPSMTDPQKYYNNNVVGTLRLLDACKAQGIKKFVFASSAACYGSPKDGASCIVGQDENPISPYGWSKYMTEQMLHSYAHAYNINSVSLRFFNVAGADPDGELGQEKEATHIIARVMESAMNNQTFNLFGNDYPTKDGTCVRDYVHVTDIARGVNAALTMLNRIDGKFSVAKVYNLGNQYGFSNKQIIDAVEQHTPLKVNYTVCDRRSGDPACLVADTSFSHELGWEPIYDLDMIVKTAYNWYIKKDILVLNSEKEYG